jgi:hypothetical protein
MAEDNDDLEAEVASLRALVARQREALTLLERLVNVGSHPRGVDPQTARALIQEFGVDPNSLTGDDGPAMVASLLRDLGLEEDLIVRIETALRAQR